MPASVDRPVGLLRQRAHGGSHDDRVTCGLVHDHVAGRGGDDFLAAGQVRHLGHEVAHRPGGHEEAGLLPQQLGRAFLERVDGRVVAEDVVAELGGRHGAAHRRRRAG